MHASGTIVLVDDDDDLRETVAEALQSVGHEVKQARNGQEAIELLTSMANTPCLVLLDFLMPVMNGAELLKVMSHCHRLASIPVVMVAGRRADPALPGLQGFVRKPVSLETLLRVVAEWCDADRT